MINILFFQTFTTVSLSLCMFTIYSLDNFFNYIIEEQREELTLYFSPRNPEKAVEQVYRTPAKVIISPLTSSVLRNKKMK